MSVRRSIAKFDKHPLMQFFTITCCRRLASGTDGHAAATCYFSRAANRISDQQRDRRQIKPRHFEAEQPKRSRDPPGFERCPALSDSCLYRSAFEPAAERNGIRNALEEAAYLQDRLVAEESEQICSIRDLAAKVAARKLWDQATASCIDFCRQCVCKEECLRGSGRRPHSGLQVDLFASNSCRR